ncbi:MAG: YgiT-type zinc finger protein [bacterium]
MSCVFCGGEIESRNVTFVYDENDDYFFIENMPAEVYVRCGEKTYSPEVTDELLHLAICNESESGSVEISPNITAELNEKGELIGIANECACIHSRCDFGIRSGKNAALA